MVDGRNQDLGKNENKEMEFSFIIIWYCECGEKLNKRSQCNASGLIRACNKCRRLYVINASCRKTNRKLKVNKKNLDLPV